MDFEKLINSALKIDDPKQIDEFLLTLYEEYTSPNLFETLLPLLDKFLTFKDYLSNTSPFRKKIDVVLEEQMHKEEDGYLDIYGRRMSFPNLPSVFKAGTIAPYTLGHLAERYKAFKSFSYFRYNYCYIATKTGYKIPNKREYQTDSENKLSNTTNDIVLSFPRQAGKTVTVTNYLLWYALTNEDKNIGLGANIESLSIEVLDKTKETFELLKPWVTEPVKVYNVKKVVFNNGTRFLTSACNGNAFRGFTINLLYVDEVAFVKTTKLWKEFTDAVTPTTSAVGGRVILTSTAKGMNHWYDIVKLAQDPDDDTYDFVEVDWTAVPRYTPEGERMTPEEFKAMIVSKYDSMHFAQNYENMFLGSSQTFIPTKALDRITRDIKEPVSLFNNVRIYEEPIDGRSYFMGVDPAKIVTGDFFAIQVLDVTTFPFKQVAVANLNINYLVMPEQLNTLGIYYNYAYIIVENNEGAGQSIADTLWNLYDYPNIYADLKEGSKYIKKHYKGFRTTRRSKPHILNLMRQLLINKKLIIYDEETLKQLRTFEINDNKVAAIEGAYDDLPMALAIVFAPLIGVKGYENQLEFIEKVFSGTEHQDPDSEVHSSIILDFAGINNYNEEEELWSNEVFEEF